MRARAKIRSVVVKVAETRLTEKQVSAICSDHFGALREATGVVSEWVVDFIDFKHPGTGDRVYSAFCLSSFKRALEAFRKPSQEI